MEEEKREKNEYGFHKLEVGQKIRVYKTVWNDKVFYKYQITQKNYDGTLYKPYIGLQFPKGTNIPNGTDIIVHQFFDNARPNPKDDNNPIRYYQINDYEIVENQEQIERDALNEYNETIDENMVEIDESFLD